MRKLPEEEEVERRKRGAANVSLCAARQAEAVSAARSGRDPDDPPINENQA